MGFLFIKLITSVCKTFDSNPYKLINPTQQVKTT